METIAHIGRHSLQQKPFLIVETIPFQWKPFLIVEAIPFSGSHSFLWKPLPLVEDIPFSGSHFLQQKRFVLVETAFFPFSGRHFFQRKPLTFNETNYFQWKTFNRWHFLYWKLFLLLESIHFSGSDSFQFFFRKAFVFGGNHCPQLKPILLEKAYFFSGSMVEAAPFN